MSASTERAADAGASACQEVGDANETSGSVGHRASDATTPIATAARAVPGITTRRGPGAAAGSRVHVVPIRARPSTKDRKMIGIRTAS
jgi:hypothetical protein